MGSRRSCCGNHLLVAEVRDVAVYRWLAEFGLAAIGSVLLFAADSFHLEFLGLALFGFALMDYERTRRLQ